MIKFKQTLYAVLVYLFVISTVQAEVKLYLTGETQFYSSDQTFNLLEKMHSTDPDKNILIYIHGRGREVSDELETMVNLETNFNVRVLMIDWPSWTSLLKRPVKNAEDASVELVNVFNGVKRFKEEMTESKNFSLLCHSMGNVVFSSYVKKYHVPGTLEIEGKPIFENLISAAPDIALAGHANWLKEIDFTERKFVLMNNRDLMLLLSYLLDLKERNPYHFKLGLGFRNLPFSDAKITSMLEPKTTYIDLSAALKSDHRYFEYKTELMINLLKPLINGEEFHPKLFGKKIKHKHQIFYVDEQGKK